MIPGIVAGQTAAVVEATPVTFVAASGTTYTTATSQNQTIPVSVAAGDLLVACVMHRAALTAPAGWSLAATASCVSSSTTQYTSVYTRVAQAGDAGASTTWTQAGSFRIAVHIQAYRKPGGCAAIGSNTASINNASVASIAWPEVSGTASGQMAVVVGSIVGTVNPSIISASSGTLTTPGSGTDNRLAAAYLSLSSGQPSTGTFSTNSSGSNGAATVSLLLG